MQRPVLHLTAAVATILIIRMLQKRRPVPTREHILSAAVS